MIVEPRAQHVRPGSGLSPQMLRLLMLTAIPGNTFKTVSPHQPYTLPDVNQAFNTASLSLFFPMQGEDTYFNYGSGPPYLELWALDSSEAEIFKIVEFLDWETLYFNDWNVASGQSVFTGTIFGNGFWANYIGQNVQDVLSMGTPPGPQVNRVITAFMPICGFKANINLNGGTGAITPALPMVGIIQELN